MQADGTCCQDLGADHFVRRNPARAAAKLANRIRNLGFDVEIRPAATAAFVARLSGPNGSHVLR